MKHFSLIFTFKTSSILWVSTANAHDQLVNEFALIRNSYCNYWISLVNFYRAMVNVIASFVLGMCTNV